jgi:prepilin peptidase CpaA
LFEREIGMTEMEALGIGLALAALLAYAAFSDLRGFRIPNHVPVLIFVLFAVVSAFVLEPHDILLHLAAGVALFVAGAALFAGGIWGGGDAKLIAAIGTWTGFAAMPRFLVVMALAGGLLALLILAVRAIAPRVATADAPWHLRLARTGHLPYGVALAAGGFDWLLRTGLTG